MMQTPQPKSPLAVHRFSAGMTQAQLAERAGISRTAVANIERGEHGARPLTAKALAAALGVPVEQLFGAPDAAQR